MSENSGDTPKKPKAKRSLPKSRSYDVKLTKEARTLKHLRRELGLSMREVAEKMGCSDSLISQIEQGRMDLPRGSFLDRIIKLYGVSNRKRFSEKCIRYGEKFTPQELIVEALPKLNEQELSFILNYIETSMATRRLQLVQK
ncbi:MAG: helix-turn-helix domain-containing protein [Bdellovibrionaceae bacterium]|nr:helix-turn-helix domain-containing protein [Pseudobdellovibrionaceae bacterium]